uniref:M-phase phosphoprotein 6 n=2 Tax=Ascaris TaxID=6251 RepID=A0A0M3IU51_ASCLU
MVTEEKGLSTAVLEMRFMQRTKNRLEEEAKRKKEEAIRKSFLGSVKHTEHPAAKRTKEECDKEKPSSSSVVFEQRYEILEDLRFGRMSFGGFNPEVEKLMKYHNDLKEGMKPEEDILGEMDVSDTEMAAKLGGSVSSSLAKKFESKRQRRDDERYNKTFIDESCVEGNRKRRSDGRRVRDAG